MVGGCSVGGRRTVGRSRRHSGQTSTPARVVGIVVVGVVVVVCRSELGHVVQGGKVGKGWFTGSHKRIETQQRIESIGTPEQIPQRHGTEAVGKERVGTTGTAATPGRRPLLLEHLVDSIVQLLIRGVGAPQRLALLLLLSNRRRGHGFLMFLQQRFEIDGRFKKVVVRLRRRGVGRGIHGGGSGRSKVRKVVLLLLLLLSRLQSGRGRIVVGQCPELKSRQVLRL